ncbi:MAG: hypothetical protein ABEK59_06815 [Halobacteria archaeon]
MANVTVTVPEDLKAKMEEHPEINWSHVARTAIQQKITDMETLQILKDFELMDEIAAESELTEEDIEELAEKINNEMKQDFLDE